jgi:hypothetical protein
MKDNEESKIQVFLSIIGAAIIIFIIVTSVEQCRESSIKARAFDKVNNEGMTTEDALQEAEYEQKMSDEVSTDCYQE